VVAYGYRYGEFPLADIPEIKPGTRFSSYRNWDRSVRPIVRSSLGCHVCRVALPHPDPSDPPTLEAGVRKRFAFNPPKAKPQILEDLRRFVQDFCRKHLIPLSPELDTGFETWLEKTPYPEWRKADLRRKHAELLALPNGREKYLKVKSFMKDECYTEYKHARGINSRTDEFKTMVGPIFKLIEEAVFKLDWFIKKVPVKDRPAYIMERLFCVSGRYFETDYTAFESLFVAELMDCCEMELYKYMVSELPGGDEFISLITKALLGENECSFKFFTVWVQATRMSGEMCTSLGNGFSNLMFFLFLCWRKGSRCTGVVEGDDGLFRVDGPAPTASDFRDLGLVIKMKEHRT